MTEKEINLVIGSLLHDIGKVIYRQGEERKKHSQSGYEFLKEYLEIQDTELLNCVRYHHADALSGANIDNQSIAYITYMADNIASAADRRQNDAEDSGFEMSMPLQSVFDILNGNRQEMYYKPGTLNPKEEIHYPDKEKQSFDESFYKKIVSALTDNFRGVKWSQKYINSLLEILEANLTYIPSSTNKGERADISLYDHVKLTAAIASCILEYLTEMNITDYKETLYKKGKEFYAAEVFCLYSIDMSGIQDFIYTITSENALKTLRVRSFYLELLMEHMIDSLLEKLHLSRANLIYAGGGHCYILAANTDKTKRTAEQYLTEVNGWLREQFGISLYAAYGFVPCSSNALNNVPEGSYAALYRQISEQISAMKAHRYTPDDIRWLNNKRSSDNTRECKVCKRTDKVNDEGICTFCSAIEKFSAKILYQDFFTVTYKQSEEVLPLPNGQYLTADKGDSLKEKMQQDENYVRAYGKNKMYMGEHIATKLWVGDYTRGKRTVEYAKEAAGIERIGILRADVDNMGQAFVSGFDDESNHNRYVTLSRTATLSRQLSLFFKCYINKILEEGSYSLDGKAMHKRNVSICYSGGDDIFIIGSWDEIIGVAIDLRQKFKRYTQGTLTISAGIGLYESKYPISAGAYEVADLEEASKHYTDKGGKEKDAVTLFSKENATFSWEELEEKVLGEKFAVVKEFLDISDERGKKFLYNILELLRNRKEKINFARYVYFLSGLEPAYDAPPEQKEAYRKFADCMYRWRENEEDVKQLIMAIYLYVYLRRDKEEENHVQ